MGRAVVAKVKPNRMKWPSTLLYKLMSNHCESREMFLHASYRNTGIDWKAIPDKIDGSG
jgi:hypothetical protein